ncbi:hypothetical protein AHF37_00341 [Paragonimus kellicotti]|nr:hypothetical protein AHF37_00341 [Paragonimus kellicotti]
MMSYASTRLIAAPAQAAVRIPVSLCTDSRSGCSDVSVRAGLCVNRAAQTESLSGTLIESGVFCRPAHAATYLKPVTLEGLETRISFLAASKHRYSQAASISAPVMLLQFWSPSVECPQSVVAARQLSQIISSMHPTNSILT